MGVGVIFGLEQFDLRVMSKFSNASGDHVVKSGGFSSDLFVGRNRQFGESLLLEMCNPFRVEGVVHLLIDFAVLGIDPVNNGLMGPKVNGVLASFVSDARSGICLDLGALSIHPSTDPIIKRMRGRGDGLHGKFLRWVCDNVNNMINQKSSLPYTPLVDIMVDARQDFVEERFPEGPGVDGVGKLQGLGEGCGIEGLGSIARLNAMQAMEPFGITVRVAIFLEEVFEPSQNLVGLRHEGDFIAIHEVKSIRIRNLRLSKRAG
jgi:hypothetical protein